MNHSKRTDPIEATLTEQRARHVENLFAIRRRLLARDPHCLTPFCDRLTLYMMCVIYTVR